MNSPAQAVLDLCGPRITCLIGHPGPAFVVLGGSTVDCQALSGGVIVNLQMAAKSIGDAVAQAETSAGQRASRVLLGVRGSHLLAESHSHPVIADPAAPPMVIHETGDYDSVTISRAHLENIRRAYQLSGRNHCKLSYSLLGLGAVVIPDDLQSVLLIHVEPQSESMGVFLDHNLRDFREACTGGWQHRNRPFQERYAMIAAELKRWLPRSSRPKRLLLLDDGGSRERLVQASKTLGKGVEAAKVQPKFSAVDSRWRAKPYLSALGLLSLDRHAAND